MTSNTTTPSPGGALEGNCEADNLYFISQAAASVVLVAIITFATIRMKRVPVGGASEDYGRPWVIGVLLFNVALWNMLPPCVMFLFLYIVMGDVFALSRQMACLQIVNIPFFPMFIFTQGILILALYFPLQHREKLTDVINNDDGLAPATGGDDDAAVAKRDGKVLMIGTASRGMFFVDALLKRKRGAMRAETLVMDFTDQRGFLVNNAVAAGAVERGDEGSLQILDPVRVGRLRLGIPLSDASVDKVVVTPFFRTMQPIGDFVTPEKDKAPRMAKVLLEAMRVLRPGGTLVVVDSAVNALLAQADIRDLGFDDATFESTGVKAGAVVFMQLPYYVTKWVKRGGVADAIAQHVAHEGATLSMSFTPDTTEIDASPLLENHDGAVETEMTEAGAPTRRNAKEASSGETGRFVVVAGYQLSVFFILMIVAAAAFSPLNVPTTIVAGTRVGNVVASTACNYPMMCYFTRSIILNSHGSGESFGAAFRKMVGFDFLAIISTLIFSTILWLPQFALQLGLSSTSLSDDAKSMIGITISILLGFGVYKFSRFRSKAGMWKLRALPEEHWKLG